MKLLGMEAENNMNMNCEYCNKSIKKKSVYTTTRKR